MIEYTETSGTGDCSCKSKGREVWEARGCDTEGFFTNRERLGKKEDFT